MLFMMALSVSSHFNWFSPGWILFLSDERSGAWGEVWQQPLPLSAARGFPVVRIAGSRQENVQNGDKLYSLSYIG